MEGKGERGRKRGEGERERGERRGGSEVHRAETLTAGPSIIIPLTYIHHTVQYTWTTE